MTVFNSKFIGLTLIAAVVASTVATMSAGLGWPVSAMFIGWVAFYTGEHSLKGAIRSYVWVTIGIAFGNFAALGGGALMPLIDHLAFGVVVFIVAIVVVSLRAVAMFNNVASYFLGLISFFAAHLPPGLLAFSELTMAGGGLGCGAALIAHSLQVRATRLHL